MHRLTGQIALAALLAFTLVGGTLLARSTAEAQTAGAFVAVPIFDARGNAFAVFTGGSVANLEAAAQAAAATGVWAQEKSGGYQLLVVNGPAFLKTAFLAAFPSGFSGATAVTLVRVGATPPPVATPTPVVGPPATSTFGAAIAQMLFQKTNEQRAANGGLAALTSNAALTAAAAAYADVVFARDPYLASVADAHSLDGQPADRATRAGYVWSRIGENIAVASGSTQPSATAAAQLLMDGWMNSPPHRANILTGAFTETAVVCSTGRPTAPRNGNEYVMVCVAMFGTPH